MVFPEYYDLFLQAQENPNALYYVVSFDVKKRDYFHQTKDIDSLKIWI